MIRKNIWLQLLFMFFILCAGVSIASEIKISTEISKASISRYEPLILTVSIEDGEGKPSVSENEDFKVAGESVFHSTEIINFNVQTKKTFSYTLIPKRTGNLKTPVVFVESDGQTYEAPSKDVVVSDSIAPSVPGNPVPPSPFGFGEDDEDDISNLFQRLNQMQRRVLGEEQSRFPYPFRRIFNEVFLDAEIFDTDIFVNQQALYNVDLYTPADFPVEIRAIPSVNEGVLIQQIEPIQTLPFEKDGVSYIINRISFALYPMRSGEMTIKPFNVTYLSRLEGWKSLMTKEFTLSISELPTPYPEDFSQGIGEFELSVKADTETAEVSKPFSLTLSVSGKGNASSVNLSAPIVEGANKFDSSETVKKIISGENLIETKELKVTLVPERSGEIEIPALSVSFFDPNFKRYYSKSSAPIKLKVIGENRPGTVNVTKYPQTSASFSIKTEMTGRTGKGLLANPIALFTFCLPFFIYVFIILKTKVLEFLKAEDNFSGSGKAYSKLKNDLKHCQEGGYDFIAQSFFNYLITRLDFRDSALTTRAAVDQVEKITGDPDLATKIRNIFVICDEARFSSDEVGAADSEPLIKNCLASAAELEKILKDKSNV